MTAPNRTPSPSDLITRRAPLSGGASSWDPETRTLSATIAAGAEVQRYDGRGPYLERLDPKGMARADHVPVLNSHGRFNLRDVLGHVTAVKVRDGRVEATLKMSSRDDVGPIVQDIIEGHIRGVSVGYRVSEWREEAERQGQPRRKTATRWDLLEVSIVPLPADPHATIRGDQQMDPVTATNADGSAVTPPAHNNSNPPAATRAETNAAIRSIAELAGLDRSWADAAIDSERSVDDVRTAAFDAMRARAAAAGSVRSTSIQVIAEHGDPQVRIRAAGEAFFARHTPGHQLSDRARAFAGMNTLDLARDCLRSANVSTAGLSAATIVERALHSSDFPLILGDAVGRSLRAAYQAAPSGLKQVGRQTTARDFRDKHRLQLSEAPRLERVNESGEFKAGTLAEAKESYRLATYGRILSISRQALVNDDLAAFSDLARRMGQAAAATEAQLLVDLLLSNSAAGPTMSDGRTLFHADHGNIASAERRQQPDVGSLTEARTKMRRQVGLSGELISIEPRFVVVAPEGETVLEQVLTRIAATASDDVNPFSGKLVPVVEPRLVSRSRWYVVADPATIDGLEFAYLEGEQGVQIETKAGFEVDGVQIRARLDFGAGFVDWRGWHVNEGGMAH